MMADVRSMTGFRAAALVLAAGMISISASLWGQASGVPQKAAGIKASTYEVVSIKPDKPGSVGGSWQDLPDGFRATDTTMSSLLFGAYDIILEEQVLGMPGWVELDPYDVEARVGPETAEAWKKLSPKERWKQEQPMLQALLADRCKLQVHRETRELPVYELVIAKGGLKMKEAPAKEASEGIYSGRKITAHATSIDSLVYSLSGTVGRMIVDKTGLGDKKFDFELRWTPDLQRVADAADAGPSIFTALEEQLGLKLVPAKGPVDVIVIDHIERPSPN